MNRPLAFPVLQPPPLALYIHFPWCRRKCPYCDFNSHPLCGALPESAYIDALLADLDSALPQLAGRQPVSLFLGGGTPSLFSPASLGRLLEKIHQRLPWQDGAEITLEANPATLDPPDFAALRAAGINRLSLGIQSFDPVSLKRLERIHSAEAACSAAELASRHFERLNLDLMYGLPEQTLPQALADVETALSFAPSHLSCYQLTLEPDTRFASAPPAGMPEDELCADMQEGIEARLAQAGYVHYETSAFAQAGQQCRHNLNYWQFGDYLGIGAGAHSKLTLDGVILRQSRFCQPEQYQQSFALGQGSAIEAVHCVPSQEIPLEFLMNALRLNQGFPRDLFEARTGLSLSHIKEGLDKGVEEGLLVCQPEWIAPSQKGQRFLNRLLELWMPDVAKMSP